MTSGLPDSRTPGLFLAILRILAVLIVLTVTAISEEKIEVPGEVAAALRAAQADEDPAKALAALIGYTGKPHALIALATAQAAFNLSRKAGVDQAKYRELAEKSFRQTLELDPAQRQAGLGLAQLAAERSDWPAAVAWMARSFETASATAAELLFYGTVAYRASDWRLTSTIATQGILRFPADAGFRRLELAALLNAGRNDEARQALTALLAREPENIEWWRTLAAVESRLGQGPEALAALEAASLARPDDRELAMKLGDGQLVQSQPQAALETYRRLLGEAPTPTALADAHLVEHAARAAADAGNLATARTWLAAVPAANRDRAERLLAARLALQASDSVGADAALRELIALGEHDPVVLVWAGSVAEQLKDDARAEALYNQAAAGEGKGAGTATLRLVALFYRQNRLDEAATLIASHLAQHPDDQQALALRAALAARRTESTGKH